MKTKLAVAAVAALGAVAFSQIALAEDFNEHTVYWPKRMESVTAPTQSAPATRPVQTGTNDDAFYYKQFGGVAPQ